MTFTPSYLACCLKSHPPSFLTQMSSAAASTVDFLCIGTVLMDIRLKVLEDAAEVSKDQMTSVFVNLEQCFDYLHKLQVRKYYACQWHCEQMLHDEIPSRILLLPSITNLTRVMCRLVSMARLRLQPYRALTKRFVLWARSA